MSCVNLLYAFYVNWVYGKKPPFAFYRSLSFKFMKYLIFNNKDITRSKSILTRKEFLSIINSSGFIGYFNCLTD